MTKRKGEKKERNEHHPATKRHKTEDFYLVFFASPLPYTLWWFCDEVRFSFLVGVM